MKHHITGLFHSIFRKAILYTALALATGTIAQAQTASDFFQRGLTASTLDAKISAFEQAVQLEPNYVEAYFYLGLAYKAKGMIEQSQIMLNKAYFTNPYSLNNNIKMRILYELGTVRALLGQTKEAQDALTGARDLAGNNRAMQGRIAYELGKTFIETGEYDRALLELREGKRLLPQDRDLFDDAINSISAKQGISEKYKSAQNLLAEERFEAAIAVLQEIAAIDPGYKDVNEMLENIKKQSAENVRNKLADLYNQASNAARNGKSQEAVRLYQQVSRLDPNYRDVSQQLARLRKRADEDTQKAGLERAYSRGENALQRQDWRQALREFETVESIDPNYRDLPNLMAQAEKGLEDSQKADQDAERRKKELYKEAVALSKAKRWPQALHAFKQLQALDPNYKDAEQYLREVRDTIAAEQQQRSMADTLYLQGFEALQKKDWLAAVLAFEKVRVLKPNYADVNDRLKEAKSHMEDIDASNSAEGGTNAVILVASGISLLLFPAIGLYVFSPTLRARVYLLQGNNNRAADTYERLLKKHPEKVKLYPILANLYLLENRRDNKAIKTFEAILRLNILTPKRSAINSIVANHYLNQGRTDGNAIAIMERELNNKLKNQNSDAV